MLSYCLRCVFVFVLSVLLVPATRGQEAVETTKPTDQATSEPTPESTPKPKKEATPTKSLEETMRPEEFKAAGLDKLSEDEMQHLDAYLQGYRESAKKKAAEQANSQAQQEIKKANEKAAQAEKATEEVKRDAAASRSKLDTLISRVDGTIDGVKGHAVIRLEDGTVWKQVNADEKYRATITDRPTAVVMHTTFGYKMRIEGMPEFYVDPVVRPQ
ncbi:MAG: hypothetical protein DME57_10565 [Verrucomicrobia bacterium]|nr:MAG: hypothetical protein DME57_10565 [Verrucomicrobiota bacterium]